MPRRGLRPGNLMQQRIWARRRALQHALIRHAPRALHDAIHDALRICVPPNRLQRHRHCCRLCTTSGAIQAPPAGGIERIASGVGVTVVTRTALTGEVLVGTWRGGSTWAAHVVNHSN
jgi:hypothetical protein